LFVEPGKPYDSGVFYCKDAFEGLETIDQLVDPKVHDQFVQQTITGAYKALEEPERGRTLLEKLGKEKHDGVVRSKVRTDIDIPTPPFWGAKTSIRIRLEDVWQHMDLNTLFRLQWGAKNAKGEEYQRLIETEFMPRLRELQRDAKEKGWLQPAVAMGYFPVQSDGNDLIVYEPGAWASGKGQFKPEYLRELTRFPFPRQPARDRLCLADYFAASDNGRMDVAVFQVVTLGREASEYVEQLQAVHDYSRSYFVHGLSVTATEGLAEYTNQIVRQGLGLTGDPKRGKRYSWGYPAIPDLEQHAQVWKILPAEELGINLTESFQIVPEQSTAAIIVHHPQASYFSIGGSTRERAEEESLLARNT
jgi:5-methyltetrahydrofolate--homocysteine methyltransferase